MKVSTIIDKIECMKNILIRAEESKKRDTENHLVYTINVTDMNQIRIIFEQYSEILRNMNVDCLQ